MQIEIRSMSIDTGSALTNSGGVMQLIGKKALITGGSEGIGRAIAQSFLEEAATVAIVGRSLEKLQRAQTQLEIDLDIFPADVSNPSELEHVYHAYCGQSAKLDILVASAGICLKTSLTDATEADFDRLIATNLKGVFFTVQKALPYLNEGASIILIASIDGKGGIADYSIYAASKAGIISFAKSFAAELAPKKIRVNSISPGFVDTPLIDSLGITEEEKKIWGNSAPLKRFGQPKEIADAALFLASDHSEYMTAADIAIDGGISGISQY
ncbi:MAG: SDR family NAD(P)-dependent oxidoreductase [Chlamydiales bacterium]